MSTPLRAPPGFDYLFRGRVTLGLVIANAVAYAIEMLAIRTGVLRPDGSPLSLYVPDVIPGLQVWQPFTYSWLHSPVDVGHLVGNMFALWLFGASLEAAWGSRKLLLTYLGGGLAGGLLILLTGLAGAFLGGVPVLGGILQGAAAAPTLGASGAVNAIVFGYAAWHYHEVLNFLFLGPVRGRTLMLVLGVIEVLRMLSYSPESWAGHMGGMALGIVVGFGWWEPSTLSALWRRRKLEAKRRETERRLSKLQVLDGGRGSKGRPDDWVN